jgi:hypothetical protein
MFFRWVFVILMALSLTGALGVGTAAQSQIALTGNYCVFHVDASRFPQVEIWLQPFGALGANFAPSDLSIYENGTLVPKENVQLKGALPVTLVIAVDQGRASNFRGDVLKRLRSTLRKLVDDGYLKDDRDTLRILTLTSESQADELVDIKYSASDLTNWIDKHRFEQVSKVPTQALVAVERSISRISSDQPNGDSGRTAAIILLTHGIEDPANAIQAEQSAQQIAQMAQDKEILVFAIDTDSRQRSKGPLDLLTQKTQGKYMSITSENFDGELNDMYRSIFGRYVVVYTSTLPVSYPGEQIRHVNLANDLNANGSQTGCTAVYIVTLLEPIVSTPKLITGTEAVAEVTWPDGYTRTVTAVRCDIPATAKCNWKIDDTRINYTVEVSPPIPITATRITTTTIAAAIRVTDSFGLSGQNKFEVNIPELAPEPPQSNLPAIAVIGIAGVCGAALVGLIIRRRFASERFRVIPPRQDEPKAVKDDSLPDRSQASLTILEGPPERVGGKIPLDKPVLILGRNPREADIVFSFNDKSSVSRIHCAILCDTGPSFKLIDKNSTGGTWLNGRRLQTPAELKNGDEIVLGNLSRKGVKLRFNYDPDSTAEMIDPSATH